MADLTIDRGTSFLYSAIKRHVATAKVAIGAKFPAGVAVCIDGNGNLANPAAANAATQVVAGITKRTLDNTLGTIDSEVMPDGTPVELRAGPHYVDGHAGTPPVAADVALRAKVYFSDNHTVSKTAADGPYGGRILKIDENGYLVDVAATD